MPYADNHGVRIHYEVEGAGSPIVLQHGITDGLESWYDYGFVDALRDAVSGSREYRHLAR